MGVCVCGGGGGNDNHGGKDGISGSNSRIQESGIFICVHVFTEDK